MPDLTDKAIDDLPEQLRARAFAIQHNAAPETVRLLRAAADTIAALRAAPVAMRERAQPMRLYGQTTFSDKDKGTHGDCFRAALCTVLQIDPTALPHPIASDGGWNRSFHKAVRDLGWDVRSISFDNDDDPAASDPTLSIVYPKQFTVPQVVMAAGMSPRGIRHSVVWDRIAKRMIHDPHPSAAGLDYIEAFDFPVPIEEALPLDAPAPVGPQDGGRPLPTDRDTLGRLVREAWVRWAQTQPNPKASWLAPYDDLDETDKEADRQIGEAIARWTLIHDAARFALDAPAPTEPHKSVLDGNDAPAPVDPVAEAARIDAKDLYYLRAILRRLREFDAAIEEAIGDGADNISLLGNQAMADEIDWLDCKIDWLTRALAQEARHEG